MANAKRARRKSTRSTGHGSRRTLAFERLDSRTVLSTSGALAAGVQAELEPYHAAATEGHAPDGTWTSGPEAFGPGGAMGSMRDFGGGMRPQVFGGGPGGAWSQDRSVIVPVALVYDAYAGGGAAPIGVLAVVGGIGPGGHGPLAIYWFDTTGMAVPAVSPPTGALSTSTSAPPARGPAYGMSSEPPAPPSAALAGGRSSGSLGQFADTGQDAGPLASMVSSISSTIDAAASASAASVFTTETSQGARGMTLAVPGTGASTPVIEFRQDGVIADSRAAGDGSAKPRLDSQGGLIELDSQDSAVPRAADNTAPGDDEPPGPRRRRRADRPADDEAFWQELMEKLDTPAPAANMREASNNAKRGAADDAAKSAEAVARFDQGGLIELAAGAGVTGATGAIVAATPQAAGGGGSLDAGPLAIEAGVALFQAFDLSTGPAAEAALPRVAPQAAPPSDAGPSANRAKSGGADAEAAHGVSHRTVLGVGAGLLVAVPLARRRKAEHDEEAASEATRRSADDNGRRKA